MKRRTCSLDGCDRRHYAKGWCNLHYTRVRAYGEPGPAEAQPNGRPIPWLDEPDASGRTFAAEDDRHGTYNGYQNLKCRCSECRAANVRVQAEARKRRNASLAPDDPRHGKYTTYTNYRCSCDACRAAAAKRERERRAAA